jgi:hypothetical protein
LADRARLERLRQEYLARLWSLDERAFLEQAWHIRHPAHGKILFGLREPQIEGLAHWQENRYSLTLKARQIGWSTLVAAHVFWETFFHQDRQIILLSRTEREAVDLLAKTKYGYAHLPQWLKDRGPRLMAEHQQRMPFNNGSSIESMPSASDPARGKSASLIVVDEWAFLPNAEDAWASIEPVADIGGRIIGLSTANGSGNFFHELWVGAETGENKFATYFAPWNAVPERDQAWYEAEAKSKPDWIMAQEYPSDPEEAFIRSGRPFFDIDALMQYETVLPKVGYLENRAA